jgi:hypothetical protein
MRKQRPKAAVEAANQAKEPQGQLYAGQVNLDPTQVGGYYITCCVAPLAMNLYDTLMAASDG